MHRSVLAFLLSVLACGVDDPGTTAPVTTPLEPIAFSQLGGGRVLLEREYPHGTALYLIDPVAQTANIVASDSDIEGAALSPSGTRIVYTRVTGSDLYNELHVFDVGGAHERLTATFAQEGVPSWRPGSPGIVYPRWNEGPSSIVRMTPAAPGVAGQIVADFPLSTAQCPRVDSWRHPVAEAPNGDVVMVCRADIWKISSGSQPTLLFTSTVTSDVQTPRWSPDGAVIAFVEPGNQSLAVRRMTASGADVTTLATLPSQQQFRGSRTYSLCWSADGSRVLFTVPVSSTTAHLWVVRADGSSLTQITTADAFDYNVTCSE